MKVGFRRVSRYKCSGMGELGGVNACTFGNNFFESDFFATGFSRGHSTDISGAFISHYMLSADDCLSGPGP